MPMMPNSADLATYVGNAIRRPVGWPAFTWSNDHPDVLTYVAGPGGAMVRSRTTLPILLHVRIVGVLDAGVVRYVVRTLGCAFVIDNTALRVARR